MRSSVELVCVAPDRVSEFWPHVRGFIKAAIDRTELSPFDEIERELLAGQQLLWLAWNGEAIEAAAATQLGGGVCTITACGGSGRVRWLHLIGGIENYARQEGCRCVRIYGRKGWERVLADYRAKNVILERQLDGRT